MSVLDDEDDLFMKGAINSAKQTVKQIYEEADAKRQEVLDHLCDLEMQRIGVPPGAKDAWVGFTKCMYDELKKSKRELFDLDISYAQAIKDREDYKLEAGRNQGIINQRSRECLQMYEMGRILANHIIMIAVLYPDTFEDMGVGAAALDILTNKQWRIKYPGTYDREEFKEILKFYWEKQCGKFNISMAENSAY